MLQAASNVVLYTDGQYIVREGESGGHMFIIAEGEAEVLKKSFEQPQFPGEKVGRQLVISWAFTVGGLCVHVGLWTFDCRL